MANSPEYRRGPADANQLPKGAAKQLNKSASAAKSGSGYPGKFAEPPARPASDGKQASQPTYSGDVTGLDSWLFSNTHRPTEPISAGAPWGGGPNYTKLPAESDMEFRRRVASMLLQDPRSSAETQAMAYRMMED